jgi:uncharacterized SAM-binding protein YcdF (DUF218 family)
MPGARQNNFSMPSNQKILGLFSRRERWGLSRRGGCALVALALAGGLGWVWNVHSFLAPTRRTDAKILVVEGWVHEYAIAAGAQEFAAGHYEKIYTTGGPITGTDGATNVFNTSASVGAERLLHCGVAAESVQLVPAHVVGRDRTYTSAIALRNWLREHQIAVQKINVLTEDCHARRTRLLFQKAFGEAVTVGIIAVPNPDYDPAHWWRYSEGVREILGESIAYLYARILFHPDPAGEQVP